MKDQSRGGQIDSIQHLRALAALMIVVGHVQSAAARIFGTPPILHFPIGSGVDLFFVISGFVMMYTSAKAFGRPGATAVFMQKRLSRIVPLYWAATTLFILILLMGRDFPLTATGIAASYAFIPYDTLALDNGFAFPAFNLGWTLNYEMFFYVIFAVFIARRREVAVAGVCLTILLLVLSGLVFQPGNVALHFWTRPILLEFCLGMLVAQLHLAGIALPAPMRLLLAILAFTVVGLDPGKAWMVPVDGTQPNNLVRVLTWGVPMSALLAAATLARGKPAGLPLNWLKSLGDASYSLYLLHPFVIIVLEKLWARAGFLEALDGYAFIPAAFIGAIAIAVMSYRFFERPTAGFLNRLWNSGRRPSPAGSA